MQNHQRKFISKISSFSMIAMFGHSWYVFECLSTPFDLIFQIGDIIWNFCCSQSFWFSSADVFPLSQILCHRWSYLNFFYHFIGFYTIEAVLVYIVTFGSAAVITLIKIKMKYFSCIFEKVFRTFLNEEIFYWSFYTR